MEDEIIQYENKKEPPTQVVLTLEDLRSILTDAIAPLQEKLLSIEKENIQIREEMNKSYDYAPGIPQEFRRGDSATDNRRMQAARSVTIATRPVLENPEQYHHPVGGTMRPSED